MFSKDEYCEKVGWYVGWVVLVVIMLILAHYVVGKEDSIGIIYMSAVYNISALCCMFYGYFHNNDGDNFFVFAFHRISLILLSNFVWVVACALCGPFYVPFVFAMFSSNKIIKINELE